MFGVRDYVSVSVLLAAGLWLCLWGVCLAECLLQVLGSVWGWLCRYLQQVGVWSWAGCDVFVPWLYAG